MIRSFAVAAFLAAALNTGFTQQAPATPAAESTDKPRVFISDSTSWSTHGSAGGSSGAFAGSSSGGARPQTAEIIKTFGERCPQVQVNNRVEVSNYIVELDHEGGKGLLAHKDKIAVFVQKSGDSIFSKSTLSLGGSVQDACVALLAHWNAHAAELKVQNASRYVDTVPATAGALTGVIVPSVTVDASAANCDIEVDGSFMGSTPSTLTLAPGKHDIVVKKSGYQDWTRSMTVGAGAVRVNADMVAK